MTTQRLHDHWRDSGITPTSTHDEIKQATADWLRLRYPWMAEKALQAKAQIYATLESSSRGAR